MVFLAVPLLELSIEGWGGSRVGGGHPYSKVWPHLSFMRDGVR